MKKIFALLLAFILLFTLCSCGNMSLGLGEFTFTKIHIFTEEYEGCIEIDKWYENSTGVEVEMTNGDHLYISEGRYIMVEDFCPICDGTHAEMIPEFYPGG